MTDGLLLLSDATYIGFLVGFVMGAGVACLAFFLLVYGME